jgi:hypothetical protein
MVSRAAALLAALALAGGLSACGGDDEVSSDIPRTSPDLTIPTATTDVPDSETSTSATTATSTSTVPATGGATPPAVAQPPAAVQPQAPPPGSTTGGAGTGTPAGQSTTGGATPSDPDFQNFCRDNPGAGPPC